LTIASASASGTATAADSTITQQACIAKSGTPAGTNTYETSSSCQTDYAGVVYFNLKDAYSAAITSGTLTASASAGNVNIVLTAGAGDAYGATTGFDSQAITSDANGFIVVTQPTSGVAGSSTLTISVNGAVLSTKTIKWTGDAASIAIHPDSITSFIDGAGEDSVTNLGSADFLYVIKDAAGNVVNWSSQPSLTGLTGSMLMHLFPLQQLLEWQLFKQRHVDMVIQLFQLQPLHLVVQEACN